MKTFKHDSHTVRVLKQFTRANSDFRPSIVWVDRTGNKVNLRWFWRFVISWNRENSKLFRKLHMLIRTPVFMLERDNSNTHVGLPNHFLWFIS